MRNTLYSKYLSQVLVQQPFCCQRTDKKQYTAFCRDSPRTARGKVWIYLRQCFLCFLSRKHKALSHQPAPPGESTAKNDLCQCGAAVRHLLYRDESTLILLHAAPPPVLRVLYARGKGVTSPPFFTLFYYQTLPYHR